MLDIRKVGRSMADYFTSARDTIDAERLVSLRTEVAMRRKESFFDFDEEISNFRRVGRYRAIAFTYFPNILDLAILASAAVVNTPVTPILYVEGLRAAFKWICRESNKDSVNYYEGLLRDKR